MKLKKYRQLIKNKLLGTDLPSEFDFTSYPFANEQFHELFELFLTFSQKNLQKSCGLVGKGAIIYIVDEQRFVKAFATRRKDFGVIGIYSGTVVRLFHALIKDPVNFTQEEYHTYQIVILFLFYHEKAHLMQRNNKELWSIDEIGYGSTFDIYKHLAEYDADIYGAIMILPHIVALCEKTQIPPQELIASAIAGIFILFMEFLGGNTQFYIEQKEHPHSIVRIFYVMDQFIRNIRMSGIFNPDKYNIGTLWQTKLAALINKNQLNVIQSIIDQHFTEINEHIQALQSLHEKYKDSAMAKDPRLSPERNNKSRFLRVILDWTNENFCTNWR